MKCQKCGNEIPENAKECPACGTSAGVSSAVFGKPTQFNKEFILKNINMILAAVAILCTFFPMVTVQVKSAYYNRDASFSALKMAFGAEMDGSSCSMNFFACLMILLPIFSILTNFIQRLAGIKKIMLFAAPLAGIVCVLIAKASFASSIDGLYLNLGFASVNIDISAAIGFWLYLIVAIVWLAIGFLQYKNLPISKEGFAQAINHQTFQNAKNSIVHSVHDTAQAIQEQKSEADQYKQPADGAIKKYEVIYRGGMAQYDNREKKLFDSLSLNMNIMPDCFLFTKTYNTRNIFEDFSISYDMVKKLELVERTISNAEMWLSSSESDMKSMEQKNNIEITYTDAQGLELVLRVEMLTGFSIYGQAGKCREMMDCLRQNGIINKFAKSAADSMKKTDSSLDELRKLKELFDAGVLTQDEYDAKKKKLLDL